MQVIAEGSDAYLDWPVTLAERERAEKLYQDNDYRLLWSVGGKPTVAAISLLEELRHAEARGLDPGDYPESIPPPSDTTSRWIASI